MTETKQIISHSQPLRSILVPSEEEQRHPRMLARRGRTQPDVCSGFHIHRTCNPYVAGGRTCNGQACEQKGASASLATAGWAGKALQDEFWRWVLCGEPRAPAPGDRRLTLATLVAKIKAIPGLVPRVYTYSLVTRLGPRSSVMQYSGCELFLRAIQLSVRAGCNCHIMHRLVHDVGLRVSTSSSFFSAACRAQPQAHQRHWSSQKGHPLEVGGVRSTTPSLHSRPVRALLQICESQMTCFWGDHGTQTAARSLCRVLER